MKSKNISIFTAAVILLILSNSAFAYSQIVGSAYSAFGYERPCLFDQTGQGHNIDLVTLGGDAGVAY
jgi:hypothetical protein